MPLPRIVLAARMLFMGKLYIVATPIGNLSDMTIRAIEILRQVDVIACEDTRHTMRLLNYFGIKKRLVACHAHNEAASAAGLVSLLASGSDVAFVSDAGTPLISDPGARVVEAARAAGFPVIPIPGVCAVSTILSVCTFVKKGFTFEGFLSTKEGKRKKRLKELLERDEAFVLYESPARVAKLLAQIASLESSRRVLIGREMTKVFEEYREGSADELAKEFSEKPSVKGEFTLCVSPKMQEEETR